MEKLQIEEFMGKWKSTNFPGYNFEDGVKIYLYIQERMDKSVVATLWFEENKKDNSNCTRKNITH